MTGGTDHDVTDPGYIVMRTTPKHGANTVGVFKAVAPDVAAVVPRSDDPSDDLVIYSEPADHETVKRIVDMTGGTDHGCESEGYYAAGLLVQERSADRARWRRVDWHPALTYTSLMIASGWLAGAWYAWQIDGDGARLTICLIGCLSTLWPGIPWQELVSMARDPARAKAPDTTRVLDWSTGQTVTVDNKTGRPVIKAVESEK